MSQARVTTRPGAYADSVRLMQVSQLVGSADGVEAALVAMATDINLDLARDMGFTVSDATADDLLIAVRATDVAALDVAVDLAEQQLAARPLVREAGGADDVPARTVRSVARHAKLTRKCAYRVALPRRHGKVTARYGGSALMVARNSPVRSS